jgi:diadenosine tetraphosphate (Ap4A) HIT family hydrolase
MDLLACPLCRKLAHLDRLSPCEVVWRFPHSVALLGPWQYYLGYCVLVSAAHASELGELQTENCHLYLNEMVLLARAIQAGFQPRKLNYELLGNQVPHLHWHLFPRYADDPDNLRPVWLAIDRAERDPQERKRLESGKLDREAISRTIRLKLSALKAPTG